MMISGRTYMKIIPENEYAISCHCSSKKLNVTHCWYQVMFGWFSTWKTTACGTLQIHELIHATNNIILPRLSIPTNDIGLITAKYLWNLSNFISTFQTNYIRMLWNEWMNKISPINGYANEHKTWQIQPEYTKICH